MSRQERSDIEHILYTLKGLADRMTWPGTVWNRETAQKALYAVLWEANELLARHPQSEPLFCRTPSTN